MTEERRQVWPPQIIQTGDGWRVRIEGNDVFEGLNTQGCYTYRAFDIASRLATKEEAEKALAEWVAQIQVPRGAPETLPGVEELRQRLEQSKADLDALQARVDSMTEQHAQMAAQEEVLRSALTRAIGLAENLRCSLLNATDDFEGEEAVSDEENQEWEDLLEELRVISEDGLCKDEGCPRYPTDHVCTTAEPGERVAGGQHGMARDRYAAMWNGSGTLTQAEIDDGWFFDDEFDGLLVNKSWPGHGEDLT